MSTAVLSATLTVTNLGPVNRWRSPADGVTWLRRNLLKSGNFNLREWELGQEWTRLVGAARNIHLTEANARIILEFARRGWSSKERAQLNEAAKLLNKLLDVADRGGYDSEKRREETNKWARGTGLESETVLAVSRYVYLSRLWPRR